MHMPRTTERLQRLWRASHPRITLAVVTVCPLLFLALTVLDLVHLVSWQQSLALLGLSYAGVVQQHRLFQFVTAPLLHANLMHLAFNMLTLWMLGPEVETALGRRRYAVFSALCAGCAMTGFLLCDSGGGAISLGYSGVIFGILVAQAILFPHRVLYIYAFFPLKMPYAVLLLAAIEVYFSVTQPRSGLAHSAHLFGALGAWAYLQGGRWLAAQHRVRRRASTPTAPHRVRPVAAAAARGTQASAAQRALQQALAYGRHAATLPQAIAALEHAMRLDPALCPTYAKLVHQWKRGIVL